MTAQEAYKILNLSLRCTPEQVHRAWRRMALRYHPDLYRSFTQQAWATRRFKQITEARDLLFSLRGTENTLNKEKSDRRAHYYSSSEKTKKEWSGIEEDFKKSRSIFEWFLDKLPDEHKPLGFIVSLLLIPLGMVFGAYMIAVFILQSLLARIGLDPYPDSKNRKGRFWYLVTSTLAAFAYLPIFYWIAFTKAGQISPTSPRIALGLTISAFVILFLLSEGIGFTIAEFNRRTVKKDLLAISSGK